MNKDKQQSKLVLSLCALFGYGSWAFYINYQSQADMALPSALIQATYAFVMTYLGASLMAFFHSYGKSKLGRVTYSVLASNAVLYSFIICIHRLNKTPEILFTLLPGLLIGGVYSILYTLHFLEGH